MDRVAGMAMGMNLEVFKEPRGLLRVILFFLAIFAFATTVDPETSSKFETICSQNKSLSETYSYSYKYPFKLKQDSTFHYTSCDGKDETLSPCCNFNSAPQFYVFVGVMAFLYSLFTIILYVFFDEKWKNMDLIPIIDFGVAVGFTVIFLIASSVWADTLTDIKHYTDPNELFIRIVPDCGTDTTECRKIHGGNFATLNVSIIFGFLNTFVWGGSVWFLLKETKFWNRESSNVPTPQITTPQFSTPQAPSPDQAHI